MNSKQILLALIVLSCLGRTMRSRADEIADVLLSSRKALAGYGKSCRAKFDKQQGAWRVAAVELNAALQHVDIEQLTGLNALESLKLGVPADGYEKLAGFEHLRFLQIKSGDLSAWGTEISKGFPVLEDLDLEYTHSVENEDVLSGLKNFRRLRRLFASLKEVNDKSLEYLRSLDRLEVLQLDGENKMTDAGMFSLKDLHSLRSVRFLPDRITATGWAQLKGLPNLRELGASKLNPAWLSALEGFPHLESLICDYEPALSDLDLSGLQSLRSLGIYETELVSPEQTKRIRFPKNLRQLSVELRLPPKADFQSCPYLESVTVHGLNPELRDDADSSRRLFGLVELRELKELDLQEAINSDFKTIAKLATLTSLRAVTFHEQCDDKFDDEAVKSLGGLRRLESLTLRTDPSSLTDEGMAVLANFANLRRLEMDIGGKITAKGMANIWSLRRLRSLSLYLPVELSDKLDGMLESVKTLTELEELHITGKMTDKGLMQLASLKTLRRLDLSRNDGYTDEGLASLMRALPNLQTVVRTY